MSMNTRTAAACALAELVAGGERRRCWRSYGPSALATTPDILSFFSPSPCAAAEHVAEALWADHPLAPLFLKLCTATDSDSDTPLAYDGWCLRVYCIEVLAAAGATALGTPAASDAVRDLTMVLASYDPTCTTQGYLPLDTALTQLRVVVEAAQARRAGF